MQAPGGGGSSYIDMLTDAGGVDGAGAKAFKETPYYALSPYADPSTVGEGAFTMGVGGHGLLVLVPGSLVTPTATRTSTSARTATSTRSRSYSATRTRSRSHSHTRTRKHK